MLARISKLSFRFAPLVESSGSAKEFLSRVKAPRARDSNPECQVEVVFKRSCEPEINVEFSNGQKDKIFTSKLTASQIIDLVHEKSRMLEAQDILKKAGLSDSKISLNHSSLHSAGQAKQIPTF